MMTTGQLRAHDDTLQAMAREGSIFAEVPGFVLYVVETGKGTFDARGYPRDSPELKALRCQHYPSVRLHYESRKQRFANALSHYTPPRPRGEEYGWSLKEPYTEAEIVEYEAKVSERMPEELREYLLLVSRELLTHNYPVVFDLSETDLGECGIPDGDCYFEGYDNEGVDDDAYRPLTSGMATIGEGGCAFSKLIVMKGNQKGSVWHSDEYSVNRRASSLTGVLRWGGST